LPGDRSSVARPTARQGRGTPLLATASLDIFRNSLRVAPKRGRDLDSPIGLITHYEISNGGMGTASASNRRAQRGQDRPRKPYRTVPLLLFSPISSTVSFAAAGTKHVAAQTGGVMPLAIPGADSYSRGWKLELVLTTFIRHCK